MVDLNKPHLNDEELSNLLRQQPGETAGDWRQRIGSVRDVADEQGRPLPSEPSLYEQGRQRGIK